MRQDFAERLEVARPPADAWESVGDVPRVLTWFSIVGDVRELEPERRYEAVLVDRLGPFKLRADLEIEVLEREPARIVRAHADGEDRQIGSRLIVDVALELREAPAGTALEVSGSYEVTGRPATLGASSIRKKAAKVLEEFFARAAAA